MVSLRWRWSSGAPGPPGGQALPLGFIRMLICEGGRDHPGQGWILSPPVQICAVLAAVTEVIRSQGGKETETEYFAALVSVMWGWLGFRETPKRKLPVGAGQPLLGKRASLLWGLGQAGGLSCLGLVRHGFMKTS